MTKPTGDPQNRTSNWITVGKNGRPAPAVTKLIRLVLELQDKNREIKPLLLRGVVESQARLLGFKGAFALSTSKSVKGNLVLYLQSKDARDLFYKEEETFRESFRHTSILEDDTCYKVAVHGVLTEDFNDAGGLKRAREDIERLNYGIKLTTDPIWLSNESVRSQKQGASILITVQTEREAKMAVQHHLFIGGVSLRAEHARDKSKANSQGDRC